MLGLVVTALGLGIIANLDEGRVPASLLAGGDAVSAPAPTRSQYLHWMTDDVDADREQARRQACRAAERSTGGPVVLAVGRQLPGGVTGFATGGEVRNHAHLAAVVSAYVDGLQRCGDGDAWTVAVTTSNHRLEDVMLADEHGRNWALAVGSIPSTDDVTVVAGVDMEPSWGSFAAALRWVSAYRAADGPPLLFNASADGCPQQGDAGPCNNGWNVDAMATTIWSRSSDSALPQIYRHDGAMAAQWGVIARAARRLGLEPRFAGAMSQRRACAQVGGDDCLDLPPAKAWEQLRHALEGVATVPGVTDVGWG